MINEKEKTDLVVKKVKEKVSVTIQELLIDQINLLTVGQRGLNSRIKRTFVKP